MRKILILLTCMTSTAYCETSYSGWPIDIVPTAKFMGLLGSPKEMKFIVEDKFGARSVIKSIFYEDGVIKERKGRSQWNVLVKRRGDVIKKVITTSLEEGNSSNGEIFIPKKYDSLGRVTLITSNSRSSNNISFTVGSSVAKFIKYNKNIQTVDGYYKRNGEIGPLGRTRTEYSLDGNVVATCWGGSVGEACDRDKEITEYGPYGKIRNLIGQVETVYSYLDGLLISELRNEKSFSPNRTFIEYKSYSLDGCGNWVSREVVPDSDQGDHYFERREISYYKKCEKQ